MGFSYNWGKFAFMVFIMLTAWTLFLIPYRNMLLAIQGLPVSCSAYVNQETTNVRIWLTVLGAATLFIIVFGMIQRTPTEPTLTDTWNV